MDEKAGDPIYRYGKQQIASRYDPSAIEEDLGDDPIKAGSYGISNLKYILKNLNTWIEDVILRPSIGKSCTITFCSSMCVT